MSPPLAFPEYSRQHFHQELPLKPLLPAMWPEHPGGASLDVEEMTILALLVYSYCVRVMYVCVIFSYSSRAYGQVLGAELRCLSPLGVLGRALQVRFRPGRLPRQLKWTGIPQDRSLQWGRAAEP